MKIKAVLFDLDGTLLPMNQDIFIKTYFGLLGKEMSKFGYEPKELIDTIVKGLGVMGSNDGQKTNEAVFWDMFAQVYGEQSRNDLIHFQEFYQNHFDKVQVASICNPKAKQLIDYIKSKGIRITLATNPLFPAIATQKRIKWAGLITEDFEICTTYENSRFCKPNLNYYKDILRQMNLNPQDCLMVGNDVEEDMVARELGMKVFLLTDNIINKDNKDISIYPNGNFDRLMEYIQQLLN